MTYANYKYCEIWNARQELVQRKIYPSYCEDLEPIVTDADKGYWTFVFGVNGKISERSFTQEIKVMKGKRNDLLLESPNSRLYIKVEVRCGATELQQIKRKHKVNKKESNEEIVRGNFVSPVLHLLFLSLNSEYFLLYYIFGAYGMHNIYYLRIRSNDRFCGECRTGRIY
jgi:hypothetical protein